MVVSIVINTDNDELGLFIAFSNGRGPIRAPSASVLPSSAQDSVRAHNLTNYRPYVTIVTVSHSGVDVTLRGPYTYLGYKGLAEAK